MSLFLPDRIARKLQRNWGWLAVAGMAALITPELGLGLPRALENVSVKLGFALLLVAAYFNGIYRAQPSPQAVVASTTADSRKFWAEALRRKQLFFACWLGWLVVGFPL